MFLSIFDCYHRREEGDRQNKRDGHFHRAHRTAGQFNVPRGTYILSDRRVLPSFGKITMDPVTQSDLEQNPIDLSCRVFPDAAEI